MTVTQNGCAGSSTDGTRFTVSGSDISLTWSTGEKNTGTVNEAAIEIAFSTGETCSKETGKYIIIRSLVLSIEL
jgi:hypothetical protein